LKLVDYRHLGPEALAEVRREAREMERRASERSAAGYGDTPPAKHTLQAGQ
jgi:hypothetical protein